MKRVLVGSCELSGWQNKFALARADLIRAYLDEKKLAKKNKTPVTEASKRFVAGYNAGNIMPGIYDTIGNASLSTIEGWVKTFKTSGYDYASLAPKWGTRRGQSKVTDDELNSLISFVCHPNRLRIAEAVRLTKTTLNRHNIPSPSSEATLIRALKRWKAENYDTWVFCRKGEKALNDQCLPYLERDAGCLDVGDVLVADGHTLNFQILHPFTGKPARMILILWYDWASAYPAGWEIMPTENIQSVAAGLRRAVICLGKIPKIAYLDNGKAFKAKIFTDKSIDFESAGFYGMFARLGIDTLFAWPYNAQSKPVERFFGTFSELERLMPTYTGTDIAHKPAHLLRNEKLHRKIHEKKYGGWVPSIEEAHVIIRGWVAEYASRQHRGLNGLFPGDIFAAGRGSGVDKAALRHLMMSLETGKDIHRNGVTFMGRNYYEEAMYGIKERVTIRYDLEDLSEIDVYDLTGSRLICTARPREKLHPVARLLGQKEDLAAVKEGIKQKRRLKKQTEAAARDYVMDAPDLVSIPAPAEKQVSKPAALIKLPRAEAEHIEAEASKMKIIDLKPKKEEMIFQSEAQRYEHYIEIDCGNNGGLSSEQRAFMRYFETTEQYRILKNRYDFLREVIVNESGNHTEISSG